MLCVCVCRMCESVGGQAVDSCVLWVPRQLLVRRGTGCERKDRHVPHHVQLTHPVLGQTRSGPSF
jgi:hypothetical protein